MKRLLKMHPQDEEMEVWRAMGSDAENFYDKALKRPLIDDERRRIARSFIESDGGARQAIESFQWAHRTDLLQIGVSAAYTRCRRPLSRLHTLVLLS